jgi:hypothetical protein
MKKVFILIAFLFTVVCYAAPPPDMPTSFLTEDVGFFRPQGDIAVQIFEAPEVAYAYMGNSFERPQADYNASYQDYGFINRLHSWEANKQNSNYSYPFGADY